MKPEDIRPEHLVTLKNVRIVHLHFEERYIQYLEADTGEEIVTVRIHPDSDAIDWFRENRDKRMDLVIFPYKWERDDESESGVVNYFRCAVIRRNQETPN